MDKIANLFNLSNEIVAASKKAEKEISNVFEDIDNIALYNQAKVLKAFKEEKVSRYAFHKNNRLWL